MDETSFEEWLEGYKRAWEQMDADAAVELFAEDATYQETPFDEPMRGRDAIRSYWSDVPLAQKEIAFGYEVLSVAGDQGIARWWCDFRRIPTDSKVKLDGIFVVHFSNGKAIAFREWWHRKETPEP